MLLQIPELLNPDELGRCRDQLARASWVDGRTTAGYQAAQAKRNQQLAEDSPTARALGELVTQALGRNALFMSAALPQQVYPPLFNRYSGGDGFGTHVDNAVRHHHVSGRRVRADLSATLFLGDPGDYDGGELMVEDTYGAHAVKLPAGHLILYPASSLHQVRPVTRGVRLAAFFWVQSLVRDDAARTLLFDLDLAVQRVHRAMPDDEASIKLTAVYNNLLRRWAEV